MFIFSQSLRHIHLADGHRYICFLFFWFLSCFLGPHPPNMEVPRLGVELELQPSAYTTATAMWDLSYICDLHHNSRQHRILNPLSEARDWTCTLIDSSQVRFHWATMGTSTTDTFGVINCLDSALSTNTDVLILSVCVYRRELWSLQDWCQQRWNQNNCSALTWLQTFLQSDRNRQWPRSALSSRTGGY